MNGRYSGYETNFYFYHTQPPLRADEAFSFSFNFQPRDFGRSSRSTLISFGRSGRWMVLSRDKEQGQLLVSFRNGQTFRSFASTEIKIDEWYNITLIFDPPQNQVQLYLNGHRLESLSPGRYLHGDKAPVIDFSFCSYGNGNVFHGNVESVLLFRGALGHQEVLSLYPSLIQKVPGHMPSAVKATQHQSSGDFEYDVDKEWTYLPACVEGDKGKEVLVTCPDGKQVTFSINYKTAENSYVILRNSFSSIRGLQFKSFEAALQKTLAIAKEDC